MCNTLYKFIGVEGEGCPRPQPTKAWEASKAPPSPSEVGGGAPAETSFGVFRA